MTIQERLTSISLRWQICLLIGIALIACLGITTTLAFFKSSTIITDLTLEKVMSETNEAASELEHVIDATRFDLTSTPKFPPIPGMIRCWDNDGKADPRGQSTIDDWTERLQEILEAQMGVYQERRACAVFDAEGVSVLRVERTDEGIQRVTTGLPNVANSEFFVTTLALTEGRGYVQPMHLDGSDVTVRFCTPFFDSAGKVRGVFVITLDGAAILARAAKRINSGLADIVDEKGMYLYCVGTGKQFRGDAYRFHDDHPVRAEAMKSAKDTYKQYVPSGAKGEAEGGAGVLATYRKVYYDAADHSRFWLVASSVEASHALRQARSLAWSFLWVGLIVLCVAGLFAFVVSGGITKPLELLTLAADQIAAGDLETELPRATPLGEVKALYGSISEMTTSLRQMIDHASAQEARTQAIFNSTADALITIDERGNMLSCNETAERLFGVERVEIIGKKASVLVPALYDERTRYEPSELSRGETRQVGGESDVVGYRRDRREVPLSLRVTEMDHMGERLYIATMQDITARKQSEQQREALFAAIRDAVCRLAAGTRDILATTTQQATGAQQQAAAVSQTVATVDEVAQTADQAAQRAGIVAEAAKQADTVGKAGRKAVEESVASMDSVREQVQSIAQNILSLAERAQAIGEIIATVSDIAEQTNVLALNAAVEASRAGEHGKGFAVVASEVKALAEQSKKATTQVRQILGEIQHAMNTAVLSIEKGTDSVNKAGEVVGQTGNTIKALEEMLSQSARTASQISASSGQQATGVIQLNEAIKNIDRVTQQNVEAIRQIEASAHSLNALSNELAGLTS